MNSGRTYIIIVIILSIIYLIITSNSCNNQQHYIPEPKDKVGYHIKNYNFETGEYEYYKTKSLQ